MKRAALIAGLLSLVTSPAIGVPPVPTFIEFESGPVRPVALTPNGQYLLVTNTPDNRLEVFDVNPGGTLSRTWSIPVGMEPVAVAARTNTEVWVVNHLSDSVSIVDLATAPPRVVRTLIVGDEPRDIVFAGTAGRAFITTAHRGQQRTDPSISGVTGAGDPQLTTPGIGRADVWVFDPANLGATFGGTPVRILTFFADTPRALATDGTNVWVAAFQSGNQSTTILEPCVRNGFGGAAAGAPEAQCPIQQNVPGGVPGPSTNAAGTAAPETGIIVQFNGTNWVDSINRVWNVQVPFTLPDRDVFTVNANTFAAGTIYQHVGTILFNMARNPVSGKIYVTNTESPNLRMFEGPGVFGGSTVQGHLSESRITVLNPSNGAVDVRHLNKHINYSLLHTSPGANHTLINAQIQHSLATPLQPVVSSDGATLYVPAFGSQKIGVFSTASIENNTFDPTTASANYITTTGGGPAGLVLDEVNNRLYVLTRFDNSVQIINPTTKATVATIPLTNPEPASVISGRRFLYDAALTSGNGEASCASCHIFGDFDSLAWNLGNPDDVVTTNNQPVASPNAPIPQLRATTFHPMKGPMTTQTLRGLSTSGGMHWRGDRVSGYFGVDACNLGGGNPSPPNNTRTDAPCSENLSFNNFIVAFEGLIGGQATVDNGGGKPLAVLSTAQMQQFTDFMFQVFEPPNPNRPLTNTLTGAAAAGETKFTACPTAQCASNGTGTSDTVEDCEGCHTLKPDLGFFGTAGEQSFEGEPQNAKVPHYRNLYTKIGMFSVAGDQVRGFGFLHDGGIDTLFKFHSAPVFSLTDTEKGNIEQFSLQAQTDLAPIVGQQVTLTSTNGGVVNPQIDIFIQRAGTVYNSWMLGGSVPECDVVVKGSVGGLRRGWVRESSGSFRDDHNTLWTDANVRALASSDGPLTYTCAPPGSGRRMGIDQNLDGTLDGLPEPGAALSLGSGVALVAMLSRRRVRRA